MTTVVDSNVIPFRRKETTAFEDATALAREELKLLHRVVAAREKAKVVTRVISSSVLASPPEAFPFPSAPAVCPKYLEALRKQKESQ